MYEGYEFDRDDPPCINTYRLVKTGTADYNVRYTPLSVHFYTSGEVAATDSPCWGRHTVRQAIRSVECLLEDVTKYSPIVNHAVKPQHLTDERIPSVVWVLIRTVMVALRTASVLGLCDESNDVGKAMLYVRSHYGTAVWDYVCTRLREEDHL